MMDLVLSVTGLVLLSPLFLAVAVWIKLDSRGPVFFRQPGWASATRRSRSTSSGRWTSTPTRASIEYVALNKHNGNDGDPRMFKIPNDPRVTRAVQVAAPLLVDELPQLLNVVKGEMSLVGPRPLILEEDQHVVDWRRQRLNLKPGVTRPLAGARPRRHPVRGDGPAGLRLRDHLVDAERPADHPHLPRPDPVAGLLAPRSFVTLSPGISS